MSHYNRYPRRPGALDGWQAERDRLMEDVYAVTGADPKY